jgi:hypothetical protein
MQIIGTYTDEEISEREAELERVELADAGFYDPEPAAVEHNEWEAEGPEPVRPGDVWD